MSSEKIYSEITTVDELIEKAKTQMPANQNEFPIWFKGLKVGISHAGEVIRVANEWRAEAVNNTLNYFLLIKIMKVELEDLDQLAQQWEEFLAKYGPIENISNDLILERIKEFAENYQPTNLVNTVM